MGAPAIGERNGRAGVIDEQPLAGAVDLAHRALQLPGEAPVVVAELRIGVGLVIRIIGAVLLSQQHQCHALAAQFLVHAAVVGLRIVARLLGTGHQAPLQRCFVHALHCGPVQAGVLRDDTLRQPGRIGDLLVRQLNIELKSEYIFNLTRIDPWCGHAVSSQKAGSLPAKLQNA